MLNFEGKRVGITSGCFDLLHYYHLNYLERCKALCDILIVGVDSDLLVHENKNKYPEIPEHHRMEMVNALKCVDVVFKMNSLNDLKTMMAISTVMFKNGTFIYGSEIINLEGHPLEIKIVPDIEEPHSTTELINRIRQRGSGLGD